MDSEHGDDFIDLASGNDIAWGDGGADLMFGGDGMDTLYGDNDSLASQYQGADLLDGGADDDLLYGQGGDDILIGGAGNDQLVGGEGKDIYIFNRGDGVDVVFDTPATANAVDASIVRFGADLTRRQVKFRPGSLFLDIGAGEGLHLEGWDSLNPQASPILGRLEFADGDVMTYGDVLAQGFDIDGTEEDDDGHDDAHPLLVGTGVTDRIRGFAGNDELQGWAGNDVLDGGSGNDRLFGMDGDDSLAGAEGADALVGGAGADDLRAGGGTDGLWGGNGNDFLDGGAGADILIGGQGDDRYAFGAGDSVFDFDGLTTIVFGAGITAPDVTLRLRVVNTLPVYSVELGGAMSDADRMFIQLSSEAQLAAFEFADGTALDHAALMRATFVSSQNVLGSSGNDILSGYAGNDTIRGGDGNDTLNGLRGDDAVFGEAGDDALDGGAGNDQLFGGAGLDTLTGGVGDDRLEGEDGTDIYVIRQGDGSDAIVEADVTGDDVLRLLNTSSAYATLSRRANGDLVVTSDGGSSITVAGQYSGSRTGIERIEFADSTVLVRADLDALAVAPISGTSSDDILIGTEFGDTLLGQAGSDILDGAGGDDILSGGIGVDTYVLGAQTGYATVVEDGTEASAIRLASGIEFDDVRAGREGDDLVLHVRGVDGGLTLPDYYAGATNWTVSGDTDESITVAELLDYIESITPPDTVPELKAAYIDDAELQYAIYLQSFGASGGVLVNVQPPSDAAVVERNAPYSETGSNGTFFLNIADVTGGPSTNRLDMLRVVMADAGAGDDVIRSDWNGFRNSSTNTSLGSFLYGNAGNDQIEGTDDADVILGGAGDDYLVGAEGNDKYYVFASDTGVDLIDETLDEVLFPGGYNTFSFPRKGIDSLELVDVAFDDVTFTQGQFDSTPIAPAGKGRVYSTLDISWRPESVVRLILPEPSLSKFGVETILFAGGKTLTLDRILPQIAPETSGTPGDQVTVNGTEGDDALAAPQATSFPAPVTYYRTTLNGFGGNDNLDGGWENDFLDGGDGDDWLVGLEGDDVLRGGLGNDLLVGGLGNDLFIFDRGDGRDRIADSAGTLWLEQNRDTLRFGADIAPGDVGITGDSLDAYLVILGTSDRVTLGELMDPLASQNHPGVDRIEFADGTVWSRADILSRMGAIPGTPFDDVIGGTNEGDVISGEAGADRLFGFSGNDILRGGDGVDDLEEWDLDPLFTGGGGLGVEPPFVGGGNNLIDSGAGDDYVYHEGHSFVIGGAGNDWIDLYGDNSVIAFNAGDGSDTVYVAGSMILSLGGGLTTSDLVLSEDAGDLVLTAGRDSLRFSRQYEADPRAWPTMRLQIVGSDIRTYDLNAVFSDFYAARAGDPAFQMALATSLSEHLTSASVNEAWAGDLAYAYSRGELDTALSNADIQAVLAEADFGTRPQFVERAPGAPIIGEDNGDVVLGTDAGEEINGGDGADWLNGGGGADTLTGGAGDDLLTGGPGADTYVYNIGDGVDTIADPSTGAEGNVVQFGAGITPDMLSLGLGSLLIRVGGSGGALHLSSFDPQATFGVRDIDLYRFADGRVLTQEALLARGFDIDGTDAADTIIGTASIDRIHGDGGDDVLSGGAGSDTYIYNVGDAADVIVEGADAASVDILSFGDGIYASMLDVSRDGDDIVLDLPTIGGEVRIVGWFLNAGGTVERVEFADGRFWTAAQLEDRSTPNYAPVLADPLVDLATDEDAPFAHAIPADAFFDPDADDTLSYSVSAPDGSPLPAWLTFDAATATFAGVPSNADVAAIAVRVTVADAAGESVYDDFVLTVRNTNDAPTLQHSIADQTAVEDAPYAFTLAAGTFADVDAGDVLGYEATLEDGSALPGWLSLDEQSGFFMGTPGNGDVGTLRITLTATDRAGESVSDSFQLDVVNTNDAPTVANPIPDQVQPLRGDWIYTLPEVVFCDVDVGDSLNYSAALSSGAPLPFWITFDAASKTFTGVFAHPMPESPSGPLTIRVTATDASGAEVSDDFALDVVHVIYGSPASEEIFATERRDQAFGYEGNDRIWGRESDDLLDGGPGNDDLHGESGNDILIGGAGADWLDGGDGNDWLYSDGADIAGIGGGTDVLSGGRGDDTYVVRRTGDHVAESAGEGVDTVLSRVTWTLETNVENLTFVGSADANGIGNALDNVITGNSGRNTLIGGAGNDSLDGDAGADTMAGGTGGDTYHLGRGYGADLVHESDSAAGDNDIVRFLAEVSPEQVWFGQSGDDLVASIIGTSDSLTVRNWYAGYEYRIEQFCTSDGKTLLEASVQNLVNAMAAFAPPPPGQEALPTSYAAALQPVIAASWQ
ncbi:MAG TPA: putative Ig domain-containing protein [Lacipirellula sp.]